ncbi:MAG: DNA translocase FtsK [Firmicutes bacterium]|nr:DNA translocase FtsK [Bacillota bacterium]
MTVGTFLVKLIGMVGLYIFSVVSIIISLLLLINTPVSRGIEAIRNKREERRLVREKLQQEREAEMQSAEEQLKMYLPEATAAPKKEVAKPEVRIVNPYDEKKPETAPKKFGGNIMKYMRDDKLFGKSEPAGEGYGLDGAPSQSTAGFGLDGTTASPSAGFGLDGGSVSQPSAGYGLDGHTTAKPMDRTQDLTGAQGMQPTEMPSGVVQKEPEQKLSKKEASAITLDPKEIAAVKTIRKYKKPPISLLNRPKAQGNANLSYSLKQKAAKLEETLHNFKVDARVVQVTQGPAVTRYEIQPNIGVKVSKIVNLADDIALNLEAKSIRIEAPIPGKAAVGIEIENETINMVTLREIIDSQAFKDAKSKITFAVGKDIAGNAIVADLKSMPHLLIAGSTGSGKSVCINSIITSILYKADPDEVKLVLIDPKVVELGNYNGIPHLLIPVVTEPTKAAAALNWAVAEMTDRYKKFAEAQVRDLESYNDTMRIQGEEEEVLPQIVIIIDELADLMMAAPSQVEESICRLAQMARAAGMHLIVATQRPSVDIITGVIKANIPSRIAFAVSSQFDSRTILDMSGAEKLVGKGDMLFNPLGIGKPVRVQGTFVSDSEVHHVIEHVKAQVEEVTYSGDVLHTIEKGNLPDSKDDDGDELLAEAIECVVSAGQASVSMLQRRFRIGYNRAARIVDMMEARGIVGPQDGSRPRQVLMTEEELEQLKNEVENV